MFSLVSEKLFELWFPWFWFIYQKNYLFTFLATWWKAVHWNCLLFPICFSYIIVHFLFHFPLQMDPIFSFVFGTFESSSSDVHNHTTERRRDNGYFWEKKVICEMYVSDVSVFPLYGHSNFADSKCCVKICCGAPLRMRRWSLAVRAVRALNG